MERTLHPLEKFPGATKRVVLPMSGIEVLVRRIGFKAVVQGGVRHALQTGALEAAALEFAKSANEDVNEGQVPRHRGELPLGDALAFQQASKLATLRNALVEPRFDALLEQYGGSEDLDDLGLGPDFEVLEAAVNELNDAKDGEPVQQARIFPAPARSRDQRPGRKVRQKTQ